MPKIEIELSKTKENNEMGEILRHQSKLQDILMQIERLAGDRDEELINLNRVVRCAVNEAKLKREDIRDIEFPPFIIQSRQVYQIIDGKLVITLADPEEMPMPAPDNSEEKSALPSEIKEV